VEFFQNQKCTPQEILKQKMSIYKYYIIQHPHAPCFGALIFSSSSFDCSSLLFFFRII